MRELAWRKIGLTILLALPVVAWAAPVISGFSPNFAQPGGVITVNGSGLSALTQFEFNNVNPVLADFTNAGDTQIAVVVPFGATTGPLVAISGSTQVSTSSNFYVAPAISSFSPAAAASPTMLTIQGANFVVNGTSVLFTGVSSPQSATVVASSEAQVQIPAGAATGPVTVVTSYGTNTTANSLTVSSGPSISGFSPAAGTNGTIVIITGANFSNLQSVKFGSQTASATEVSTTEISATVPASVGSSAITVTTSAGSVTSSDEFLTGSGPIVTNFSPNLGPTNTAVTLYGFNLAGATGVNFNGKAGTITSTSANLAQAYVPFGASSGSIKITTPSGSFTTSNQFTVSSGPYITGFQPVSGQSGTQVVISGYNFYGTPTVKFGGVTATTVNVESSTEIIADVPGSSATGPISVGSFTTSTNFYDNGTGPIITGISPSNGVRGLSVTINGGNFQNITAVKFNGVNAAYSSTATTEITATVPSNSTSGPITVTTSSGAATSSGFFYMQPWITSLSSNSGIVNATFYINGRSLTNATSLSVGGVTYAFSNAALQLAAMIPSNAVTGRLQVTTPGGLIITPNQFDILPKIYSFSPNIGPAGTVVDIYGTSLFEVTNAQFGVATTSISGVTSNQLQASVPANAVTGPITVVSPYGNDVSSNTFIATKPSLLVLTKTATPAIAGPGTNVTYTIQVTNEGPSIVTGVTITDTLPGGLNYVSSGGSRGNGGQSNQTVVWNFGLLTNSTSASFQVVATSGLAAAITNTAVLAFNEGNLAGGNDLASAITYFATAPQRTLTAARLTAPPGLMITWPNSGLSFQLQMTTNLANSNGWTSVSVAPFISNNLNIYTNTFANPAGYYRLEAP